MRKKITLECPMVLNHQLTQDVLKDFEQKGIDGARCKFYKEFEKRNFHFFDNEDLWILKRIIDGWS